MALPVTISTEIGGENSFHGPFKGSNGAIYVATVLDVEVETSFSAFQFNDYIYCVHQSGSTSANIAQVFKATDPTVSFTEVDSSNRPALDFSDEVRFCRFNMGDDTWDDPQGDSSNFTVIDQPSVNFADAVSIGVLSDGKIRIVFQGDTDMDMGTNYDRIDESRSTDDGVNFSAPTQVDNGVTVEGIHYRSCRIVMPPNNSDQCHIIMCGNNAVISQRAIANDNTLRTWRSTGFSTLGNSSIYPLTNAMAFIRSGVSKVRCAYVEETTNDLEMLEFDAFDDDTAATFASTNITTNNPAVNGNNDLVASIANDGSHIHGLFAVDSDDDLFPFDDANSDSYTVGTEHLAGTITHVSCNIFHRDGQQRLAMLYEDGATVQYDEIDITFTALALLSGADMAQQNMFHGPFEI